MFSPNKLSRLYLQTYPLFFHYFLSDKLWNMWFRGRSSLLTKLDLNMSWRRMRQRLRMLCYFHLRPSVHRRGQDETAIWQGRWHNIQLVGNYFLYFYFHIKMSANQKRLWSQGLFIDFIFNHETIRCLGWIFST